MRSLLLLASAVDGSGWRGCCGEQVRVGGGWQAVAAGGGHGGWSS